MNFIVFTDLDGTLLDHEDYSFQDAVPALKRIVEEHIPLIFTTSKTRLEVEHLQDIIGIHDPFIVENGAAIVFPDGYRELQVDVGFRQPPYSVIRLGTSYREIREFMDSAGPRHRIKGFGDLSVDEVARLTGLSAQQAALAKRREFTEPFLLQEKADVAALEELAKAKGLKITRGGRFFHLIGMGQDKGKAVRIAAEIFSKNAETKMVSIGLGDSVNDIPLLENVDIPVVIPRPDGRYLKLSLPNVRKASQSGSRGWNEVILKLLDDIKESGLREPGAELGPDG